jgi:hypothetical protein
MAVFSHILVPSDDPDIKIAALATATASTAQTIGQRQLMAINADQDITIVFYLASNSTPTPAATNFRIPQNSTMTFDMGHNDTIKVFNLSGSTAANIYIKRFTRI